jgi:hypothetical protein
VSVTEPKSAVNAGMGKERAGRLRLQLALWLLAGFCTAQEADRKRRCEVFCEVKEFISDCSETNRNKKPSNIERTALFP